MAQQARLDAALKEKTAADAGPDSWFELLVDKKVKSMGFVPDGMAPGPMRAHVVDPDTWADKKHLREGSLRNSDGRSGVVGRFFRARSVIGRLWDDHFRDLGYPPKSCEGQGQDVSFEHGSSG